MLLGSSAIASQLAKPVRALLLVMLLCLSCSIVPSPRQASASPELELEPAEGLVGDSITLHGSGFTPFAEISVSFGADPVSTSPDVLSANESGSFTAEFEVPYYTPAGTLAVGAEANSGNESASAQFDVVNTPPVADEIPAVTVEEGFAVIGLTASDANGDFVVLSIAGQPTHGTLSDIDEDTGEVIYTPDQGYAGADNFTFTATDGLSTSEPRLVNISTVPGVNSAPEAYPDSVEVEEDSGVEVTLDASDPDGDELTFEIVSEPHYGTLTGTAPDLVYEPDEGYVGADSFRFTASDGESTSDPVTIEITVIATDSEEDFGDGEDQPPSDQNPPSHPNNFWPVADSQSVSGTEDTPVKIVLTATDLDNDPLTFSITADPQNGEITAFNSSGVLTYTPAPEYSGQDSFTFIASDGHKKSAEQTVSISIAAVNDPPRPISLNVTAAHGTVNVTLGAFDPEGDKLNFGIYSGPNNGTLVGTAPELMYVADEGFAGYDKFLFTVTDNHTETWIGVISVLVEQDGPDGAGGQPPDTQQENDYEQQFPEPAANETVSSPPAEDPSTTKARADKSTVLVMVDWDSEDQSQLKRTLHLKFAEYRSREPFADHVWYDLVMLDDSNNEILRKNDLIAINSEDAQDVSFPSNGTYHFEVNVKGLIDESTNDITGGTNYTGRAMGTVVVPEFSSAILLLAASVMAAVMAAVRFRAKWMF